MSNSSEAGMPDLTRHGAPACEGRSIESCATIAWCAALEDIDPLSPCAAGQRE
jgi:hypothetical protein